MPNEDYLFTAKAGKLSKYLKKVLSDNAQSLGLRAVYYADQSNIPYSPVVCVEPARVHREMFGAPLRTNNEFLISVLVYAANVEGVREAQEDADAVSERVEDFINHDGLTTHRGGTQFGGNVMYGYVQDSQFGYVQKPGKLFRANRLLVYAFSRTNHLET